jgi:tetratricopeptide (TPR) repeat protein
MDQCIEGTGFEANLLRSRLAQVGRDGFAKAEATDLRRFFADAQPDPAVSVSVSDERDANRLTVRARYLLQPWSETGSEEPQTFRYSPRWLLQFLQCPDTTSRRFPFGLRHPTDVVQLLRVHGNFRNVPPEDHPLEARWFQSRVVVDPRQSRSLIEFRYEYRSGTKTVEAADCGSYSREFRAMADKMGCVLEWMPGGRESAVFSHSVAASPPTGGRRGMAPPALPPASHRRGVSRRHRSEGKKLLPIWAWILAGLALLFVGLPAALIVGLAVLQATSSPASVNIPGPQDLALEDPRPAQIAASLQAGNRERALELILGLERDYPRHAETDLARARYHMRTGETREALAYTERLLRRLPDHPLPRHLQANIMVTANHPDTGRTVETLVRDFPNSAEAWGLSALWNYRQHRLPDSETAWRKAVEFAPDNPDILRDALAFLIAYRGLPEAVALARQCAERAPGSPFIQFFFATVLVEAGDFAGALAAVDKALALDPGNPVFLARKAGVLEALGQPEASATTEKLALELGAEVFEVQWDLGCTANRRGRWDDAERLLRKAVALRPDSADALNALGYTLLEKGEWSEARSHLEAAVRLHPLLETAWENLVILSAKEGNKTKEDEAREQLDRLRRELKLPP